MWGDRTRAVLRRGAGLLVLFFAFFAGCGRGTKSTGDAADSIHAEAPQTYVNPAEIPHPSPPQPSGPQVGKSDAPLNAAAPELEEWVGMWRTALPGFAMDSVWSAGSVRWMPNARKQEGDIAHPEGHADIAFRLLGVPSPDGRYVLDVDHYQVIQPGQDTLLVGGEPDSQPLLIDRASSTEFPLQSCGTPCGFHWGRWLSTTRFALGGWLDADDYGQWKQGSLSIYSLRDSTVHSYVTRIVSTDVYAAYHAAWMGWLMKRYRTLRQPT